jgi:hypothetical protein
LRPSPIVRREVRVWTAIPGLLWVAAGLWATIIVVVGYRLSYDVLWLAVAGAVMSVMALVLLIAAWLAPRFLGAGLAASSRLAPGLALLFAVVALNPPEGLGNVETTFVVLMVLCATSSAAILGNIRGVKLRSLLARERSPQVVVGRFLMALAGIAWIGEAMWAALFASISSALGGDVSIDLIIILFMVVIGVAMVAAALRNFGSRATQLTLISLVAAIGLSLLSGLEYVSVLSAEGTGGGELFISAVILAVCATFSLLAILSQTRLAVGDRR